MACGLPVISSDCKSGPREILAPSTDISQCAEDIEYAEYGILTPAFSGKKLKMLEPLEKSEEKLRDAMVKILTDDQMHKRMSKKSLDRAQAFDVTNIIKEWDFLKNN